ncbi:MAG: hypothetical protein GC159_22930 [Phycisphaera sp.]|nr:hypothetical protein [Phycisphaera sp.]
MTTFAHLTIATRDVYATAEFFEKALGWKDIAVPNNTPLLARWLAMGDGQQLHIINVDGFEPSPFEQEFGRHFAIFHASYDFDDLQARLREHGAELIAAVRPTPFRRFFFRDPNGYVFEVIDRDQYVIE